MADEDDKVRVRLTFDIEVDRLRWMGQAADTLMEVRDLVEGTPLELTERRVEMSLGNLSASLGAYVVTAVATAQRLVNAEARVTYHGLGSSDG